MINRNITIFYIDFLYIYYLALLPHYYLTTFILLPHDDITTLQYVLLCYHTRLLLLTSAIYADIPTSCDKVLAKDPSAKNGLYEIDPDGPNGLNPFIVSKK